MSEEALLAQYRERVGAGMRAPTEETRWIDGAGDEEISRGIYQNLAWSYWCLWAYKCHRYL